MVWVQKKFTFIHAIRVVAIATACIACAWSYCHIYILYNYTHKAATLKKLILVSGNGMLRLCL